MVALGLVIAIGLPVIIGTIAIVRRAFSDDGPGRVAPPPFSSIAFRVNDGPAALCALLADNAMAHTEGMQRKNSLLGYDAILFRFADDTRVSFVNHFVPIDLSIGWFDARGRLVDHTTMEKCPSGENCPTYASKDPFRYAVETPIGGLERLGLTQTGATLHVGGSC